MLHNLHTKSHTHKNSLSNVSHFFYNCDVLLPSEFQQWTIFFLQLVGHAYVCVCVFICEMFIRFMQFYLGFMDANVNYVSFILNTNLGISMIFIPLESIYASFKLKANTNHNFDV